MMNNTEAESTARQSVALGQVSNIQVELARVTELSEAFYKVGNPEVCQILAQVSWNISENISALKYYIMDNRSR